ncbi:MAG: hypothetical protein ACRD1L_14075, partial [Terriglobales bacterium]
ILDHAAPLAALGTAVASGAGQLFPAPPAHRTTVYSPQAWFGAGEFFAANPPPGAELTYYLTADPKGQATIEVSDASGTPVRSFRAPAAAGLNRAYWDLHYDAAAEAPAGGRGGAAAGPWAQPGTYKVALTAPGEAPLAGQITVTADPESPLTTPAERQQRARAVMSAYELERQLAPAQATASTLALQLAAMRAYATALGPGGGKALAAVEEGLRQFSPAQAAVLRALAEAAGVERAMDAYEGLPTAAQLRQLGWAWEDGVAAAAGLNQFLAHTLPGVHATLGQAHWTAPAPVAVPKR